MSATLPEGSLHPVPGTPAEVRTRLRTALLPMGSVWFPTRKELRDWEASELPLYVRWRGGNRLEVGPRLASMWASCFSPVLRGELRPDGEDQTTFAFQREFPRVTRAVLALWAVLLTGWGALLAVAVAGGELPPGLAWWAVLAGSATAGPAVGWSLGGAALDRALPWLQDQASRAPIPGEDW